jgi:hypothetical protein
MRDAQSTGVGEAIPEASLLDAGTFPSYPSGGHQPPLQHPGAARLLGRANAR